MLALFRVPHKLRRDRQLPQVKLRASFTHVCAFWVYKVGPSIGICQATAKAMRALGCTSNYRRNGLHHLHNAKITAAVPNSGCQRTLERDYHHLYDPVMTKILLFLQKLPGALALTASWKGRLLKPWKYVFPRFVYLVSTLIFFPLDSHSCYMCNNSTASKRLKSFMSKQSGCKKCH